MVHESLATRQKEMDAMRRTTSDQFAQLQAQLTQQVSKFSQTDSEIANLKKVLSGSQEQTINKFAEVDKAMSMFHGSVNAVRQELTDSRQDWKKGQDLLGQAIGTLSQDLADFQKHMSTVQNKLQSQVYLQEEQERASKDKLSRLENQMSGMQQNLYSTANEVILMRKEKE